MMDQGERDFFVVIDWSAREKQWFGQIAKIKAGKDGSDLHALLRIHPLQLDDTEVAAMVHRHQESPAMARIQATFAL
jgi:hypothetical protein